MTIDLDKKKNPQTAWLFDVDGVLTDPEIKRVTLPEIFNELIERLEKGEPVGLNTGRSLDFIIIQILDPLEAKLNDRSLLKNIIAVGEKGAAWITYSDDGVRIINVDRNISVPKKIQHQIRELVSKSPYSNIMFYDETKMTMVTIELKLGNSVNMFKTIQQDLKLALQILLKKNNFKNVLRIDLTRIAIDVENKHVSKALGARKFIQLLEERKIDPKQYICFGDGTSDYEMFEELIRLNKKSLFVFVGGKEHLIGKDTELVIFTEQFVDKGTLQYLQSH